MTLIRLPGVSVRPSVRIWNSSRMANSVKTMPN